MSNCTNPSATNYNPNATTDDGSCIYLTKLNNVCYAFQDVAPELITDNSYTMSWSLESNNWVFYHDYFPDHYIQVREKLYNLSNGKIYRQNAGDYGKYHDVPIHSFFVDIAFPAKEKGNFELNTIEWVTSVLNTKGKAQEGLTLTHITAWNDAQCTGRVPLSSVFQYLQYDTNRETQGVWSFNLIRDILINPNVDFLNDLFHNFSILTGAIDANLPWYEQQLLEDNHVIIRFEYDNVANQNILLHETDININNSPR